MLLVVRINRAGINDLSASWGKAMFDPEKTTELLNEAEPTGPPLHWQKNVREEIEQESDYLRKSPKNYRLQKSIRWHTTAETKSFASPSHFLATVLRDLNLAGEIQDIQPHLKPDYLQYAPEGVTFLLYQENKKLRFPPIRSLALSLSDHTHITHNAKGEGNPHPKYAGETTLIVVATEHALHAIFYRIDIERVPTSSPIHFRLFLKHIAQNISVGLFMLVAIPASVLMFAMEFVMDRMRGTQATPTTGGWLSVETAREYEKAYQEVRPIIGREDLVPPEDFLIQRAAIFLLEHCKNLREGWSVPICFVGEPYFLIAVQEWAASGVDVVMFTSEEWQVLRQQGYAYHPMASFSAKPFNKQHPRWKYLGKPLVQEGLQLDPSAEYWAIHLFSRCYGVTQVWRRDGNQWSYVALAESYIT